MNLKTPFSLLRPWEETDRESLVRSADNPRIAAFMRDGFPHPYSVADADRFIAMATGDHPNLFLTIEVHGEAVGGIGIHRLDDIYRHTAEIGYWLAETYWGRGIVSDAIRALLPVAFDSYDLIRIQAGVFSNNPGSMRVLEKNGFSLEAVHKRAITKQGVTLNEYLYVRFRDDSDTAHLIP
ncbi:MAG: GNAT family N-acetyltransferase [Methanospirillum sp.]|uniref:GNAT family N-acetyltransferase n=1 Tax=Methanospirillum sp. TaxID=45200 RepID=UPI002369C7B6|nr:GNAT family protein [Methanospirillum sp.]MDD1730248.1 GNAT family N-acetyltransferase [Methanospirillum sp.]